ncbi:CpaF family protein [Microbacterium halophytorum]|uniref:CpaF family protein n=1 Tax=Microbacterium halophytorum TaxID=2067568 RepID=UPI001E417434|nr:ATPase, T2SS/T4P/T4SS family [Microbacterium halophytorum]
MSAVPADLTDRIRSRLRAESIDPARDDDATVRLVRGEMRRHNDMASARGFAPIDDEAACEREVLATLTGYGVLDAYLSDDTVEELWINGPDRVFVARGGRSERLALRVEEREIRDLVERMLHSAGRRVDLSQPVVDASLPDGSRLHVVIPDVARRSWLVNIRRFLPSHRRLGDLVAAGSLDEGAAELLRGAMASGRSVVVSGATHAGKTTMLGALLAASPPEHRIVTVEETFELAVDAPDLVAMQGRQPSLEGTGEITLRRLVREALRMRPDRIVVGEVRDAEALDLVLALNTGVPCAATVHANSAADALAKLAMLPLLAGRNIDRGFIAPAIARSVDLVVHCERLPSGGRRVAEIAAPTGEHDEAAIATETVWRPGAFLRSAGERAAQREAAAL